MKKQQTTPHGIQRVLLNIAGYKRKRMARFFRMQYYVQGQSVLKQDPKILDAVSDVYAMRQMQLVTATSSFPVYQNTRTVYMSDTDEIYKALADEVSRAKKFIFLSLFEAGENRPLMDMLDALAAKVSEGVDVRLIYDSVGAVGFVPLNFVAQCRAVGIHCTPFTPVYAGGLKSFGDHRKLAVIDGNTAFTGSLNLLDTDMPGHCLLLRGDAVWSFTAMFLTMWDYLGNCETDFSPFAPTLTYIEEKSFVMPFGHEPTNKKAAAKSALLKMISSAVSYIYLQTPALNLDSDMLWGLITAARSGVDILIATPNTDKRGAFRKTLLAEGIRLFECVQSPVHAMAVCCDDNACYIGTAGLDAQQLDKYFECGIFLFYAPAVLEIKARLLETFAASTEKIRKR